MALASLVLLLAVATSGAYGNLTRKNIKDLTNEERSILVRAMTSLQEDTTADGFQSLAAYHAVPAMCPTPGTDPAVGLACCVHGMPSFPQWHRLYVVQFEDALKRYMPVGNLVGVPYWDTAVPNSDVPAFLSDAEFEGLRNPWTGAKIAFENKETHRQVNLEQLSEEGPNTWSFKQYLLALEQDNYCDFEVQFEVAHNAIHAWLGGHHEHSMAHLHYASYDPAFLPHHSFTDRVFATWQGLQALKGQQSIDISCTNGLLAQPLLPFSFGEPYNLNAKTSANHVPDKLFDYSSVLGYQYDTLTFAGKTLEELNTLIENEEAKTRTFATFMLGGIKTTAHVEFSVCDDLMMHECVKGGFFDILGGTKEMPWAFDRPYKYDITDVVKDDRLAGAGDLRVQVTIKAQNGTDVSHVDLKPAVIVKSPSP